MVYTLFRVVVTYDHFHLCIIERKWSRKASAVWWYIFFAVLTNPNPASSQFQRDQWGTWVVEHGNDVLMLKTNLKAIRNPQNPHRFYTGIRFAFITIQWNIYGEETYAMEPVCENLYGRQILVSNGSLCFSQGAWGFGFEFCVCSLTHRVHGTGINIPTFSIKHQPHTWMVCVRKNIDGCLGCVFVSSSSFIFGLYSWIEVFCW